jgi:hypothetical protein
MCAIVLVIALLTVLPGIIRLLPVWIAYIIGAVILVPMAAVNLSDARARWLRIAVWVVNVLVFSLLYWQIDRGGPEARINSWGARPDWLFPQGGAEAEIVPAGWNPAYVDYLFLAYSTSTAFSATDTLPLTSRAKLLMMLESSISLVTILVVAARAINILG